MKVVGLFAGIGGLELGLSRQGHETLLLCEIDPFAQAVLRARFPGVPVVADVRTLTELPAETQLLTAGFPCQDLSQAGGTRGIRGRKSGVVAHLFRLLQSCRVPHVLIENVSFMLRLERGRAMRYLIDALEELGYRWAFRVVDARAFGLPQRRERVFLLASLEGAPENALCADNAPPREPVYTRESACGFYWTEGTRGLGWAVDAIPTLKGGSGIGIPSPPAIWMPGGAIVKPTIDDAERLQGFPRGWTEPALEVGRKGFRWRLVGNAVPVNAAEWLGEVVSAQPDRPPVEGRPMAEDRPWPIAARGGPDLEPQEIECTKWPRDQACPPLRAFLEDECEPLSYRAVTGFLDRLTKSSLRYPPAFLGALRAHQARMRADALV